MSKFNYLSDHFRRNGVSVFQNNSLKFVIYFKLLPLISDIAYLNFKDCVCKKCFKEMLKNIFLALNYDSSKALIRFDIYVYIYISDYLKVIYGFV